MLRSNNIRKERGKPCSKPHIVCMLANIDALEREIEAFYDNVFASNELMRIMKELSDSVAKQNKVMQNQSELLEAAIKSIASIPAGAKPDYSVVLQRIEDERQSVISALESSHDELRLTFYDAISTKLQNLLQDQIQKLAVDVKSDFSEQIAECKSAILRIEDFQKSLEAVKLPELSEDISEMLQALPPREAIEASVAPAPITPAVPDFSEVFAALEEHKREAESLYRNLHEELQAVAEKIKDGIQKDIYEIFNRISVVNAELAQQLSSEPCGDNQSIDALDVNEFMQKCQEFYRVSYDIKVRQEENDRSNNALSEHVSEQMDKMNKKIVPIYLGLGAVIVLLVVSLILG